MFAFASYRFKSAIVFCLVLSVAQYVSAQQNLLLNGDFEDINTCSEYHAECGVEAWFYMSATHVQLSKSDINNPLLGNNTLTVYYNWLVNETFTPVIGTVLPCRLQKGQQYHFKGIFTAKANARLNLKIGIALGDHFYVPRRPFSQNIQPDSIVRINQIKDVDLFTFDYPFTATGNEIYLTFGTFITENVLNGKHITRGEDVISLTVDHFQLLSDNPNEVVCTDWQAHKNNIYNYDFRHKEMDYSLYAKGDLPIAVGNNNSGNVTKIEIAKQVNVFKTDTLRLGDVLFDFNQAKLKPAAVELLKQTFNQTSINNIDSIFVEGHTDAIGTLVQNLELSRNRSQAVKDWLVKEMILPADKIQIHPFGKSRPIATNTTPQGRSQNRRVELVIFRKNEQ